MFQTDVYLNGSINPPPKNISPPRPGSPTISRGQFADERDGQVYQWIKINSQIWMAQNLNYKTTEHSWEYRDDERNGGKYGRLYSFDVLLQACPKGWHVPTDTEWMLLERDLGLKFDETGLIGSRGYIANRFLPADTIGFNVLYAGWRNKGGRYSDADKAAYFWTSTGYEGPIANRVFEKGKNGVYRNTVTREVGLSLRCVKDYW